MPYTDPFSPEISPAEPLITLPGRGPSSILPYDDFRLRLEHLPSSYAGSMLGTFPYPAEEDTEHKLTAILHGTPEGRTLIDEWVRQHRGRLDFLSHQMAKGLSNAGYEEEKEGAIFRRRELLSRAAAAATFGFLATGAQEAMMERGPKREIAQIAAVGPAGIYTFSNYADYLVEERFLHAVQALNDRIEESYGRQFEKPLIAVTIAPGLPAKGSTR